MKHQRYFPIVAILGILIATFGSCKKTTTQEATATLRFDSIVIADSIPLLKESGTPSNKLDIKLRFPVEVPGGSALLKQVQSLFVETLLGKEYATLSPKGALDAFASKFKTDYLKTAADYNKAKADGLAVDSWGNTYQTMHTSFQDSARGILSFTTYVENYMGGAHGSHHTGYYNIDLKTGKLLSESDIFKPSFEAELTKAIIAQLVKDNKLSGPESLLEKGYFDLTDLKPNNNFLIKKDGILYAFNEYEIAPYYMGLIQVFLPYTAISHILKKK